MRNMIDISLPLSSDLPAWPDSSGFCLERTGQMKEGDPANVSRFRCDVHFGTHVDASLHFFVDGTRVDELSLEILIGPAVVAHLPDCSSINSEHLEALDLSPDTERLLLRTANSLLWARGEKAFYPDYVALTESGANWIADRGIRLLGVDYLSVQRFNDGPEVHRILLQNGVVLLEGINLDGVVAGGYELICLPLNLIGAEGAPARAVLRTLSTDTTNK